MQEVYILLVERKNTLCKHVLLLITIIVSATVLGSNCLTFATTSDYTVSVNDKIIYTAGQTRTSACRQMRTMAAAQWSLENTTTYTSTHNGTQRTLLPGSYTGLPYSQLDREFTDLSAVQNMIDSGDIKGTDCSSSVCHAWRAAVGHTNPDDKFLRRTYISDRKTPLYVVRAMLADALNTGSTSTGSTNTGTYYVGDYMNKVGDYGVYTDYCSDAKTTSEIIRWLTSKGNYPSGQDLYGCIFAQIKPGDAIVTVTDSNTHTRMVLSVHIYTAPDEAVLPDKSFITTIEQHGSYAKTHQNSDITSSWRIKDFTFRQLVDSETPYLPVRLKSIDG